MLFIYYNRLVLKIIAMKKSLFIIAFISICSASFAADLPVKPIKKGLVSVGIQPVFSTSSNKATPRNSTTTFTRAGVIVQYDYMFLKC